MNTEDIVFEVAARNGEPKRLVIAKFGHDGFHRSKVDTDSAHSREAFFKQLAAKVEIEVANLVQHCDCLLVSLGDQADAEADQDASDALDALDANPGNNLDEGENVGKAPQSQATILVEMVLQVGVLLFHDPDGNTYAQFPVDDHCEIARINSGRFKKWMARLYHEKTGKSPNSQAKADAAGVLEGRALYDGEERPVFIRLAETEGRIYVDLCNSKWQAVEVDANGWRIIDKPPVMFRRAKAMLALPTPTKGGSLDLLRKFIDTDNSSSVLIVAWLIAALRPGRPYPILELDGEQGSGKSTIAKMLRSLVDPNTADLRSEPREPRDLMIAACNGHVVALDNLSHLPAWLSDCLCRLASGGGFSIRTLYENDEETIFSAIRPIILNGIEPVASRGDLIDRGLLVSLLLIPEHKRRPEAELWADFEAVRPAIFGALLTAVSTGLKNLKSTQLSALPRMADFALWVTAAETALGLQPGEFMAAYTGNRDEADSLAIESSVIGKPLLDMLSDLCGDWEGNHTELLKALEFHAGLSDPKAKKPKHWPANARSLSGAIKRIAPHLRKLGWHHETFRTDDTKRGRMVAFRKEPDYCVHSVQCVQNPEKHDESSDVNRTPTDANEPFRTQTTPEKHSDRTHRTQPDAKKHSLSAGCGVDIGEL